jgi:hypothetical protein
MPYKETLKKWWVRKVAALDKEAPSVEIIYRV